MSNAIAIINAISTIAQAVSALAPDQVRAGASPVGTLGALDAAWAHLSKAPQKRGLDPVTNARCNALTQANTALFAAMNADTQAQSDALTQTANALLRVHDHLAGVEWYTLPSTVREIRAESLRINESAENREVLYKIVDLLTIIAAKSIEGSATSNPRAKR